MSCNKISLSAAAPLAFLNQNTFTVVPSRQRSAHFMASQ